MSEVQSGKGVEAGKQEAGQSDEATPPRNMVAPSLRVYELKDDDDGHSSSGGTYASEDEPHSHGEISDQDVSKPAEREFVPPDDDLKEKIIKQVEFYFSDANILKDAFLLKHVRRNKQGYVSLKLITSFKKVKSLTKDYRVVAFSLKQADKLEVNEEETKVRRKEPLPDYDETTPSRTVVVVNLPIENPTIENVAELFSHCGDIALIRILRPTKSVPNDVKKHINKHPEIGNTMCAVVEFESHDSARKACETMTNRDDWRGGMRVVLLAIKKEKETKHKGNKKDKDHKPPKEDLNKSISDDGREDGKDEEGKEQKRRRKRGGRRKNSRVDELKVDGESPCSYSSGSEAENLDSAASHQRPTSGGTRSPRNSLSPKPDNSNWLSPNSTPRSSPGSSPKGSPRGSPTSRRKMQHGRSPLASEFNQSPGISPRHTPQASPEMQRKRTDSEGAGSSPSSPWVQRRLALKAQQDKSPLAGNSPGTSPLMGRRMMAGMESIIRQPRGPDGTRGFAVGRGKTISISPLVEEEAKQRSETV